MLFIDNAACLINSHYCTEQVKKSRTDHEKVLNSFIYFLKHSLAHQGTVGTNGYK